MPCRCTQDGRPAELYEAVEALDPGFFADHPTLRFELRRCQVRLAPAMPSTSHAQH